MDRANLIWAGRYCMEDKYKLLLVDDEPWALIGLEEIIDWEKEGFTIVARCACGKEAMQQAEILKPDVVITDIRMPDISGLQLIKQMREFLPHLQCVIVSAYSDFAVAREAILLSASGYILKPLLYDEVKKTVALVKEKMNALEYARTNELPVIEINQETLFFPQTNVNSKFHYLLLAFHPSSIPSSEINASYYQPVRIGNYYGVLTDKVPEALPASVGISIAATDLSASKYMFETARASLEGGFRFVDTVSMCKTQLPVAEIQLYLYHHLNEVVKLKDLAESFFLSETYLCDLFKKYTGETITGFLRKIRINHAKLLLKSTQMALQDIAYQCGYNDYSYFGRQFKSDVGIAPELYRKKYLLS